MFRVNILFGLIMRLFSNNSKIDKNNKQVLDYFLTKSLTDLHSRLATIFKCFIKLHHYLIIGRNKLQLSGDEDKSRKRP